MNMIRLGLAEMDDFNTQWRQPFTLKTDQAQFLRDPQDRLHVVQGSDNIRIKADNIAPEGNFQEVEMETIGLAPPPRMMLLKFGRTNEVESILKIVLEGVFETNNTAFLEAQRAQVRNAIRPADTCQWLLDEVLYSAWERAESDRVLFIVGAAGTGKTVLAKFITERLLSQDKDAVTVSFFCKSTGTVTTPANILRHVILQFDQQCPDLMLRCLWDRPVSSFAGVFDIDVLWILFRAMCEKIGRKIFIIIDGVSCSRSDISATDFMLTYLFCSSTNVCKIFACERNTQSAVLTPLKNS